MFDNLNKAAGSKGFGIECLYVYAFHQILTIHTVCQIVNLNIFQITNIFNEFSLIVLIFLLQSAKLLRLQSFTVELRQ